MQSFHDRFCITTGFCIVSVLLILSLPIRFVIAFVLAVSIHELGHYLMLRFLRISTYRICLSASGARIECEGMLPWQEFFISLSGPVAGLVLLPLRSQLPLTAVIAFVHTIFNLIPIGSLDGGRALRCFLVGLLGHSRGIVAHRCVSGAMILLLLLVILWICVALDQFYWLVPIVFLALIRQFPVKSLAKRRI